MIKRKILCLAILLMTLPGCQIQPLTPRAEVRLAQRTFEETIDSLIVLKDNFDEEEWNDIIVLAESGEELLTNWTLAVIKGEKITTMDKFNAILLQLIKYEKGDR